MGRLRSKTSSGAAGTSSVIPSGCHLPQRGRLIYTSTSLANIHLEQIAYRYLLHRGAKFHHGKVKACRDAKGDEKESRGRRGGMCPPIRPLGPAQRVPAGKTTEKKEARKTFILQTYTGKTVVLRTPCFPSDSCFLCFAQRRCWAAAQTRLRDFIPQTPIFASRV